MKCLTKNSSSHVSFSTSNASEYGDVVGRRQLGAAPLEHLDEPDRLAVERGVLAGRRRPEVRLQRHVAQVLQPQQAEVVGVVEDRRDRAAAPAGAGRATFTNGSVS